MTSRRARSLGLAGSLLAATVALGCAREEAPPALSARPVVLAAVEPRDLEERIEASGQLIARNEATIASEVSGRITEIVFDEGEALESGDVILEIDPERRQLELDRARASLGEARAMLGEAERESARMEKLHERQIASVARLDDARTQLALARSKVDAARAQVRTAERAVADASVRAPFAGSIARRLVSRGEFVNAGQDLVELVSLEDLEIEFHLAERDSARVRMSQPVRIRLDPFPRETFAARVSVISPTIDPRTRTLRVRAAVEDRDPRLRPGLFARADLGVSRRQGVLMVPEEAVLQRAEGSVVYRLRDGNRVQRVPVETGLHREGFVEVRTGLDRADRVVRRGHHALTDGEVVSPRSLDGTPVPPSLVEAGDRDLAGGELR